MSMIRIISIVQIGLSVLLVSAILLQSKGVGLGGVFGGEGNVYRTKRGAEKFIFVGTIVLSILFVGTALAGILLKR